MTRHDDLQRTATWDPARITGWLDGAYDGEQVLVLSNREPYSHEIGPDGAVIARHSTSGLVTALEPLVRRCGGVWIAHGSGAADRRTVTVADGLDVPPGRSEYRLRRVWLDATEEQGYYYGFANEALWPLCHRAHVPPVFRLEDFTTYWAVNERFADAVYEEAESETPVVLVQDYHFALAPQMIRERLPHSTIVTFWHIPWPEAQTFEICPWGAYLLGGLLASDIVGFQTPTDGRNFIAAVDRSLDAHFDRDRNVVTCAGREARVRTYPASIEWPNRCASLAPPVEQCRAEVREQLQLGPDVRLGVGIDRLDYTKGLDEKFLAVERLLDCYPEFRGRFAFAQIAAPSRECLPAYRQLRSRVAATVARINERFGTDGYRPAILLDTQHEPEQVYRFMRAADLCHVGSLHDGMNLVAKEFAAARDDERGVLVLSAFAGASRELTSAVIVNPYSVDDTAHALARALRMPDGEQEERMRHMRAVIARHSAEEWAGQMLTDAAHVRRDHPVRWQPESAGVVARGA